jgi:hypothetical protein
LRIALKTFVCIARIARASPLKRLEIAMSSKPIADQIAVRLMQKFYLDQQVKYYLLR